MGVSVNSMTYSKKLEELVREWEKGEYADGIGDCACMTSTGGHDNDGSTGPEMIDNGVALAFACRDFSAKHLSDAKIFWAYGEQDKQCFVTAYYHYGIDEDGAVADLTALLTEMRAEADS